MPQWLPLRQVEPFASAIRKAATVRARCVSDVQSAVASWNATTACPQAACPARMLGPLIGVSIAGALVVAAAVVLTIGGVGSGDKASNVGGERPRRPKTSSAGGAAVATGIIDDYATRLRAAYQSENTQVQRDEEVAAAVEELKERVGRCETVAFYGRVAGIIPEGPKYAGDFRWKTRNRWGITMSLPEDFEGVVRDGICTFGNKVWVELQRRDALSIRKGDPIMVEGPVSYVEGAQLMPEGCIAIQVWPNSGGSVVKHIGLGDLGTPHTIIVPVAPSVTCSVGPFKSLRVHKFLSD